MSPARVKKSRVIRPLPVIPPLAGQRVLVGRARKQAGALSEGLREHGAEVLEIPFIEIRPPRSYQPLDNALRNIADYDWLILTSVNGVEAFWDRVRKLRLNKRKLAHLQIAAIGPATKKAIETCALKVDVVPEEYVAESVVRSMRDQVQGKRVLLVRAKIARDVIPNELRAAGAHVNVVEAYETVIPAASRALLRKVMKNPQTAPTIVTFTSSSTVKNFVALLAPAKSAGAGQKVQVAKLVPNGIQFASIGPVTSATLRELGLPVHIEARTFTIPGLVRAIVTSVVSRDTSNTQLQ
jgi:uroporphyrinogen-III synthase